MAFSAKKFTLCFEANLWHCTNLQLQNGFDHSTHTYSIKLKCYNCEEIKEIEVRQCSSSRIKSYLVEVQNRRNIEVILPEDFHANYQGLCSTCSYFLWVKMKPGHGEPYAPKDLFTMLCDEDMYGKMMVFEVYGGRPCGYKFGGGWQVEKKNGETIEGIDLSSGFWAEDHEAVLCEECEESEEDESGSSSCNSETVRGASIFGLSAFYKPVF